MTDHNAEKIISMSRFTGKLDLQAKAFVRKIQNTTLNGLEKLVRNMLDKADDALFDLANKADSNTAQQLYFDAMRDIRLKRRVIEAGLSANVNKSFERFSAGETIVRREDGGGDLSADGGLELVDAEDMEELIAIKNMSAKAERECYQELYDLTARLEAVTKRRELRDDDHPLSPGAIAHAFGDTITPLGLNIQVKLIMYKLFEKYVMSAIGALHKEVNSLLIKEGILPKVRRSVRKGSSHGHHGYQAGRVSPQDQQMPWLENDPDGVVPHVGAGYAGGLLASPGFGGVPVEGANLVGALSAIQGYVVEHGYPDALSPEQVGVQVLNVSRQIGAHGGGSGPGGTQADEKTINMVSLIFDYILEDQHIPNGVKALLARLQIPLLKVALLDKEFFSRKQHPARQLLNEMARASVGWDEGRSRDGDSLADVISVIVDNILSNFDSDPTIFAALLEEFRGFIKLEEERIRVFEERAQKTTEGKERVEFARQRTEAWIEMWASREQMPEFIRDFLRTTWKNTLLVTMHRHGEDSREWAGHIKTVNNLLWSITPKKTAKGGRLLVEMIPSIVADVRKGMEIASAHPETIEAFLRELARLHAKTVNGGIERALDDELERLAAGGGGVETSSASASGQTVDDKAGDVPTLFDIHTEDVVTDLAGSKDSLADDGGAREVEELISRFHHEATESIDLGGSGATEIAEDDVLFDSDVQGLYGGDIEEIVLQAPGQGNESPAGQYRDEYDELAENLECGTWVEFVADDQESVRAKLSWKSPLTSCCLFVNRKGLKIAEKTVSGLAADLRSGRARTLEEVPLLDRAINALWDRGGAQEDGESQPS